MSARVSVFAHSREMRNDHATKLTILDLLAGIVDHFDQDVPLGDVIDRPHLVDPDGTLVRTARGLGISFGDE